VQYDMPHSGLWVHILLQKVLPVLKKPNWCRNDHWTNLQRKWDIYSIILDDNFKKISVMLSLKKLLNF